MQVQLLPASTTEVRRAAVADVISHPGTTELCMDPLVHAIGSSCFTTTTLLDLSKATLIDSSGVAWLIQLHKRFQEGGGTLILHSVPPMIMQVLNLLRMGSLMKLVKDESTADAMATEGR